MIHEKIELWGRDERRKGFYRGDAGDGFVPAMDSYILDGNKRRPAVLICPGGGYGFRSPRESEPVALQFNAAGFHAFVLRYSVAPRRHPLPLLDVSRAVGLLREKADAWKIHPDRIALCGFSAGAHLAASLGVFWDRLAVPEFLPEAAAAGLELRQELRQEPRLLPRLNRPDALEAVSLELHVSAKTPPAFLWHTYGDEAVPLENSLLFAGALRSAGVPFEFHVYPEGLLAHIARHRRDERCGQGARLPCLVLDAALPRVAGRIVRRVNWRRWAGAGPALQWRWDGG
jgi:acetyl esterase/lipase